MSFVAARSTARRVAEALAARQDRPGDAAALRRAQELHRADRPHLVALFLDFTA